MEQEPERIQVLAHSEALTDPLTRVIEISFVVVAMLGLLASVDTSTISWIVPLAGLVLLVKVLRSSRISVGLDGIAHRRLLATCFQPFESLENVDVQRVSDGKCWVILGSYQTQWVKSSGIDEVERLRVRDWLRSAVQAAKEGASFSSEFSIDSEGMRNADDSTLLQLSMGFGTSLDVRVLAICNLVPTRAAPSGHLRNRRWLRRSMVPAASVITDHILTVASRRFVKRAFRVASQRDLEELRNRLAADSAEA